MFHNKNTNFKTEYWQGKTEQNTCENLLMFMTIIPPTRCFLFLWQLNCKTVQIESLTTTNTKHEESIKQIGIHVGGISRLNTSIFIVSQNFSLSDVQQVEYACKCDADFPLVSTLIVWDYVNHAPKFSLLWVYFS